MSDGSFEVVRSTKIDAAPETIFPLIAGFKKWIDWSPWEGMDPNLEREYSGPDSGVGAKYAWKGNRKVGQGNMEITKADQPGRVELDLHFLKPFDAQNLTIFEIDGDAEGGTTVTWRMQGKHKGFMKVMGKFMNMDKMVGRDFEKGLAQLKTISEAPA